VNSAEIKKYWDERAIKGGSNITTNDIYMRRIEIRVLAEQIWERRPVAIGDIGCGDGLTTCCLARKLCLPMFYGLDFSEEMVRRATTGAGDTSGVLFRCHDITQPIERPKFNMIYTTRCLINLPTWEEQMVAIKNIRDALLQNGIYVMIENFIEGHYAMNLERRQVGLSETPVRPHNLFFNRQHLLDCVGPMFDVLEEVNISSIYYLVTRVVYAKICADKGVEPDYADEHHRLASGLPFAGEYGPIRMIVMRRR
jgi:SAM-dependent methyltransferase